MDMTDTTDTPAAPAATDPGVKRYQAEKLRVRLVSIAAGVGFAALTALLLGPLLDPLVRPWAGDGRWGRLMVFGIVYGVAGELIGLPFDFWSGFVLEHRYGLSTQSAAGWWWKRVKGYLLGGPLALLLLAGLYGLVWSSGPWWWVWATVGWLSVTLVLGQLAPVLILPLFYNVEAINEPGLLGRLRRLAEGTGLRVEGVYRLGLSAETKKANAALTGLGRTRRVLLGDTLLDEFTPGEIDVVFAHEVGHHVYGHLPKLIVINVAAAAAGFWLIDVFLRWSAVGLGYAGYDDPAALPLLLLVLTVFGLALMPAMNALSRTFERQCDRYALERTGDPDAYRSAFEKLAKLNKADPDPHPWEVWFFDDHPPIRERLALAEGFVAPPPAEPA